MVHLSKINLVSREIVDAGLKVHTHLGPGLLESAYVACLASDLRARGLAVREQVPLPIRYAGATLDISYRLDLLVEELVVVEVKAVAELRPVHHAQLLSYLRLSGYTLGILLNFHVVRLKQGIVRIANRC